MSTDGSIVIFFKNYFFSLSLSNLTSLSFKSFLIEPCLMFPGPDEALVVHYNQPQLPNDGWFFGFAAKREF